MSALVQGGMVVTTTETRQADILVRDGRIDRVQPGIRPEEADEVIDASGLHVFPGFIDPHVHARDPGQTHKEDFAHLTRAAAAGGITTVLVMPNAVPPVDDPSSFSSRARHHEAVAHVDFGLWGLVLGRETLEELEALRDAGIVAAKLFWGYAFDRRTRTLRYDSAGASEDELIPPATNGDVWRLFEAASEAGITVGMHCEDHSVISAAAAVRGPVEGPLDLLRTRPPVAESIAVTSAIELTQATGAHAHLLHMSSARAITLARRAQSDGLPVTAETCPHYLTLEPDELKGARGRTKAFPPARGGLDTEGLWRGVVDGTITSLSSDHAPHAESERSGTYARQPAGIAGTETMVPLLLDAWRRRKLSLELLADRLSESTARLYGLHPRKGSLQPGADGDLTIVNLERPWRIEGARLHSKDRITPWEDVEGQGAAVTAMVRGRIVMRDGQPLGDPIGRLVRPDPGRLLPEPGHPGRLELPPHHQE